MCFGESVDDCFVVGDVIGVNGEVNLISELLPWAKRCGDPVIVVEDDDAERCV